MTENEVWTIDELVELTEKVKNAEVEYQGKTLTFQYCELTEKEEPKFTGISEELPEQERMELFQELGAQRVLKMLLKANEKNPEGPVIQEEQWSLLPTTLRYAISNKILGVEELTRENFRD